MGAKTSRRNRDPIFIQGYQSRERNLKKVNAYEKVITNLALNLKLVRLHHGLTQEEVAHALDLHQSALSRVEESLQGITEGQIAMFALLFQISVDDLLFKKFVNGTFVENEKISKIVALS